MSALNTISVRLARPEDAVAIATVHVATWRDTYPGLIPESFLVHRLSVPRSAAQWQSDLHRPQAGHVTLVVEVRRMADGPVTSGPPVGAGAAAAPGAAPSTAIVGFASAGPARDSGRFAGELYALYVLPDFQNGGLGRLLINRVAQRLLENGIDSLYVEVLERNPSRFFYEAMQGIRLAERNLQFAGTRLPVIVYGWTDLISLASDLPRQRLPDGPS
ncbi:MAG: GNAT family N-acetyltransferase [Alphaproteobacteria bacterium]